MMDLPLIPDRSLSAALAGRSDAIDPASLEVAEAIVSAVRERGETAIRSYAEQFGELSEGEDFLLAPDDLERALESLEPEVRAVLERTADRISAFARAQRGAVRDLRYPVPGGSAGHRLQPIERVGCYAPGGRYPLPSSVLMTAVTARETGARLVWVASPRPTPVVLAAASIAGVDGLLKIGGAHAIAALAFGVAQAPACDIVVGPGGTYVTAAKHVVSRYVRIDMLAGPSELVVVADGEADPNTVAADLLAQAEHDLSAVTILVTTSSALVPKVRAALEEQLATLPTREVALHALRQGATVVCSDLDEAVDACNAIAPEHLQLSVANPSTLAHKLTHFGSMFLGAQAAEVLGDYGFGPNHVLPTGRTAQSTAGLSVLTFLRAQTWMEVDDPTAASAMAADAAAFARMEGLEAHARAAERRVVE